MVLALIALTPQAQVFYGPANVKLRGMLAPFAFAMSTGTFEHQRGDFFKRGGEFVFNRCCFHQSVDRALNGVSIPQPMRAVSQHDDDRLTFETFLGPGPLPAQLPERVEQIKPFALALKQIEEAVRCEAAFAAALGASHSSASHRSPPGPSGRWTAVVFRSLHPVVSSAV